MVLLFKRRGLVFITSKTEYFHSRRKMCNFAPIFNKEKKLLYHDISH
ncbi:hypothetical protein HMPREF3034_01870 [Prevotella sp. DNF00663]|nr:hypothetical protein HMPREF3034_01870 [Prevotella sp. DNF00663]